MIYEKVQKILNNKQPQKQAIVTLSAAVDVDIDSHISVDKQCLKAVLQADSEVDSLDGLELEEVIEVKDVE